MGNGHSIVNSFVEARDCKVRQQKAAVYIAYLQPMTICPERNKNEIFGFSILILDHILNLLAMQYQCLTRHGKQLKCTIVSSLLRITSHKAKSTFPWLELEPGVNQFESSYALGHSGSSAIRLASIPHDTALPLSNTSCSPDTGSRDGHMLCIGE